MYISKPKPPIRVNFGRSCDGRYWYILWPFGLFYGHLVHFSRFGLLQQEKSGNPDYKSCNPCSCPKSVSVEFILVAQPIQSCMYIFAVCNIGTRARLGNSRDHHQKFKQKYFFSSK
jgi:hypothetical protein